MANSKYVMTGHIDYDVDITVHGKIASEVYDTMEGAQELYAKRDSGYGSPKVIIPRPLSTVTGFDPMSILGKWWRYSNPRINWPSTLRKHGIALGSGTSIFASAELATRGKQTYDVYPIHVLGLDGSFEYTIDAPLPPSMVNNMLTVWQKYLRFWSDLGDCSLEWFHGEPINTIEKIMTVEFPWV